MKGIHWRDYWFGAFCGALLAIAFEPATSTIRLLVAPDTKIREFEQRIAALNEKALANATVAGECSKKLADVEFRAEARQPADSCVRELDTIKHLSIKEHESARVLGGRLYIGLDDAWTQGVPAGCKLHLATSLEPGKSEHRLEVAESAEVSTAVGDFRIIVAGVPDDGVSCVLDIVKVR